MPADVTGQPRQTDEPVIRTVDYAAYAESALHGPATPHGHSVRKEQRRRQLIMRMLSRMAALALLGGLLIIPIAEGRTPGYLQIAPPPLAVEQRPLPPSHNSPSPPCHHPPSH